MATSENIDARLQRVESSVSSLNSNLNKSKTDISKNKTNIEQNKTDIDTLKSDVSKNANDISIMKVDQANTNADVRLLKTNVSNINEDIVDLANHVDYVDEKHDNLEKKHTEEITVVNDEIVNIYKGITKIEDTVNEIKNNGVPNRPPYPNWGCGCMPPQPPEEPEEPVLPENATILDKLVADYLKEQIGNILCTIIPRHDISSNWTLNDPVLTMGEYGVEDDTHRIKRGDGTSKWSELPYETFGIESIVADKASDISYDNSESGLQKFNVQDVLDFLIKTDEEFAKKFDKKEDISNRKDDLSNTDNVNSNSYPTTKAVVDYVRDVVNDLPSVDPDDPNHTGNCLPEVEDTTKDYTLQNIQGETKWVENQEVLLEEPTEQLVFNWDGKSNTENPDNLVLWQNIANAVLEKIGDTTNKHNKNVLVLSNGYIFSIKKGAFNFGSITTRTLDSLHLVDNEMITDKGYTARIIRYASFNIDLDCTGAKHEVTGISKITLKHETMNYLSATDDSSYLYMPTNFNDPVNKYYVDDKFNSISGGVDVSALQQKIDDQQTEINTLKSDLQALQNRFDSLIDLNEEEF